MINRVNKKCEHVEFSPGDLVLVSATNWPLPQGLTPKFNHKYYGPYNITKQINSSPTNCNYHNLQNQDVFHVNLLKRFHANETCGHETTNNMPTTCHIKDKSS